jgi:hypothetical protein
MARAQNAAATAMARVIHRLELGDNLSTRDQANDLRLAKREPGKDIARPLSPGKLLRDAAVSFPRNSDKRRRDHTGHRLRPAALLTWPKSQLQILGWQLAFCVALLVPALTCKRH